MSFEKFRERIEEKIEEKEEWWKKFRGHHLEGTFDAEGEVSWVRSPLKVNANEAQKTHLPGHLSFLVNEKEFWSAYADLKKETIVGEITIFDLDEEGKAYGKHDSIHRAGIALARDVKNKFRELADAMREGDPEVSNIVYLFGASRLATIAQRFGFDVYDLEEYAQKNTVSHAWAQAQYKLLGAKEEQIAAVSDKTAKFAIIHREKFIELFSSKE